MSIQLIRQYYSNVDKLMRYGGTRNEMSFRKVFQELSALMPSILDKAFKGEL